MLQEQLLRRLVDFAVFNNARIGTMKYLLAIAAAATICAAVPANADELAWELARSA